MMSDIEGKCGFAERTVLNFGEEDNDRTKYLRMMANGPDCRIIVPHEDSILGLTALQPEGLPDRLLWKRYQFITADEIRNDLKIQPRLSIKPEVRLFIFDPTTILQTVDRNELERWIDMLFDTPRCTVHLLY